MPARVPSASMPEAGGMTDEDLIPAGWVAVRPVTGWTRDPLPARRMHYVAEHNYERRSICLLFAAANSYS